MSRADEQNPEVAARRRRAGWGTFGVAGALSGLTLGVLDGMPGRAHGSALIAAGLIVVTIVIGVAVSATLALVWHAFRICAARRRRLAHLLTFAFAGGLVALATRQIWTARVLAGAHVDGRAIATTIALAALTAGALGWALATAFRDLAGERTRFARAASLTLLGLGGLALALERAYAIIAFEKPFSFIEGIAQVGFVFGVAGFLASQRRLARARVALDAVVAAAVVAVLLLVFSPPLRAAVTRSLPSVTEEPTFAARWLRRIHRVAAWSGVSGPHPAGSAELVDARPPVADAGVDEDDDETDDGVAVDAAWIARATEWPVARPDAGVEQPERPPPVKAPPPFNVAVFFVDTLRADTAHDTSVMPETASWMSENISFTNAYSSGSSTLLSLAPLLGCRYDATPTARPRLIDAARSSGMRTALIIPKSASDYHRAVFPAFRFQYEDVVPDFDQVQLPTAHALVDRSLEWLKSERPERFFLWLYHFDLHGWGELDEPYLDEQAKAADISKAMGLGWRYHAAARGVDQAFARFRSGLSDLGLLDNTIVVFVSDHGEALGQRQFWRHSTFLWESLLRVPMALQIPNMLPERRDEPTSTVDLGTTLAGLVGSRRSATCHGENILAPDRETPRRMPIQFAAMVDGQLVRVGMLGEGQRKIVFDLRDSAARLLRIDGDAADEDVSEQEPDALAASLAELVKSPIYPKP